MSCAITFPRALYWLAAERSTAVLWLVLALALMCAGCATRANEPVAVRTSHEAPAIGDRAARLALQMVGRPYRYGGSHPSTGFDCSGLVQFTFYEAGLRVPRSTEEQRLASVPVRELRPGDLLFFDQEGKKNSHVGIYIGDGEFVHAPSSGKSVRIDRLGAPYWRRHLSELRRLEPTRR